MNHPKFHCYNSFLVKKYCAAMRLKKYFLAFCYQYLAPKGAFGTDSCALGAKYW
jgi:hypothetical protein